MMIHSSSFRAFLLVLVALTLVFSCSDNGDKRSEIRKELGQPDDIVSSKFAGQKSELWIYARKDINRTYEFRKTTSGCGGDGEWYVYRRYYTNYLYPGIELYLPPEIVHEPIEECPAGKELNVTATVTDDVEVVSVTLFYRAKGVEEYSEIRMLGGENNSYAASIPPDFVTTKGLEYYIEAWDSDHSSSLPEKSQYFVEVKSVNAQKICAPQETTQRSVSREVLNIQDSKNQLNKSPVAP